MTDTGDLTGAGRSGAALRRSEAHLHALFEHSLDALLLTAPDGRILMANPAACAMFGRTEDELRLLGRSGVVDPSDPRLAAALAKRERHGSAHAEFRCLRADGTSFPAEVTSAVFEDADGELLTSMIIRDTTEREHAAAALRESEGRFRLLAEAAFEAVAVHEDGIVVDANHAFSALFGYEAGEVLGRRLLEFVAPESADVVAQAIRTGAGGPYDAVGLRKDGKTVVLALRGREMTTDGRKMRVVAVRDMTASKQTEQERERLLRAEKRARLALARQNERLRQLDQLKDELVSTVSHELRTPLTSLRGFLELLLDEDAGPLTADQRRYVEAAEASSDVLLETVQDLLQLARLDTEGYRLERAELDVNEVARRVVQDLAPAAAERGAELRLDAGTLPVISADADALRRLLDNLVVNAIKFGEQGRPVVVRTRAEEGGVLVEVENAGTPIPKREQQKIFERFVRGSNAMERAIGGSGLGLAIVKAIAEAHGGSVTVRSNRRATTFGVLVPAR